MGKTHIRHENRRASGRDVRRARDTLVHEPQGDKEPVDVPISIFRELVPSDSSTPNKIASYVIDIEAAESNDGIGLIVQPTDLRLEIVSKQAFNEIYDRYAATRGFSNSSARKRESNMRGLRAELGDIFIAQVEEEKAQTYEQTVSNGRPARSIFESEIQTIYYPPETISFERGEADFILKSHAVQHHLRSSLVVHTRRDHPNFPVVADDMARVNDALKQARVAGVNGLPSLKADDFSFEIDVFNYTKNATPEGLVTPLVPAGIVAFQPLSIHELR